MDVYQVKHPIITRNEITEILNNAFQRTIAKMDEIYADDDKAPINDVYKVLIEHFHGACKVFVDKYPDKLDDILYLGLFIGLNRVKDDFLFRFLEGNGYNTSIAYWVNYYLKETKI